MNRIAVTSMALVFSLGITGCATTKVSRVDTQEEVALSDRWNDTDSRLVAEEMIDDMLSFPWVREFELQNKGKRPTVIIQKVRNKSHEHISVDTFINDIKRAVIRSGRADFVVGGDERELAREEVKQQDVYASENTRLTLGEEQGASFGLSGSINSIVDSADGTRVTFYQIDLKLIDLQSHREVWNGQKKLKKVMERSRFGL